MNTLSALLVLLGLLISANSGYSPKLSLNLAYYSSIAYESTASINAWSCSKCHKYPLMNVKAFNTGGEIQGFTGFSTALNAIILAFRGSSNIPNWIINLSSNSVTYSKCSGCKVHNGFYAAWNAAKATVNSQIQALRALHRGAPIYITGHSLGGALATLSAPDIKEIYGGVHLVHTFGEPRVGNHAFSDYYKNVVESLRVVHYGDIVPHVPPTAMNFFHQGHEIWYDKTMKSYRDCGYGESSSCSDGLSKTALNTGDHSMDAYITLPGSTMDYILKSVEVAAEETV